MIIRYGSTAELRTDYMNKNIHRKSYDSGSDWFGGESEADSLRFAEIGDTRLVPKAEALLEKLDTAIETSRKVWEAAPSGAYVCVPDVLAGRPTPMRRLTHQADETAPITILVVTTSSAAISASVLAKRGTVILALVMALSRIRPVSLQQICAVDGRDGGETIITSEINTAPLDLATACYVLTSAGFARRLTYGLAEKLNHFSGSWPAKMNWSNSDPYFADLKTRLVADPAKCLIIKAAQLNDELLAKPVEWVNKQIAKFTQEEDEGEA